ncbi:Pollen_Ole_e_I domain-containing protein [Cephalotus follicularis]|uniref:Pollen_Ole_e_I domain-containing protein n=1 Tax=Cephalotus follicularis TaxID=3775 RepID=A0A1Q3AU66_CEPFO|nr:Pollen_Ole_e_I domain-containing protein [Cephalotus follicularis]
MAKLVVLLFALCVLPALAIAARPNRIPFLLQGRVYCDTCRAGFETPATTYIAGAKVKVECKDRKSLELKYSEEATTDSTGTYKMIVQEDHEDQLCDAMLVSSPQSDCSKFAPGRERARVILTRSKGIVSDIRYANTMGFMRDDIFSGCSKIMEQYQEFDN